MKARDRASPTRCTGHPAEAIPEYEAVLRLAPHDAEAARYLEAARRAVRP